MFNMFQRLGDQVRIANRSNLTNSCCSGVIQTGATDLYVTPCYHVQKAYANFAGAITLRVVTRGEAALDLSATRHPDSSCVTLFVVNYGPVAERCGIDASALRLSRNQADVWMLTGPSLDAVNNFQEKERVAPEEKRMELQSRVFEHQFPTHSVSVLRFQ